MREVERLDALRSTLAGSFGAQGVPADESRNPRHRLAAGDQRLSRLFAEDHALVGLWLRTELDGRPGTRYLRRIRVEAACLA